MKNDDMPHKDSNIVVIKALNIKMQRSSEVAQLLKASTAHPGDHPRLSTWRTHSRRRESVIHVVSRPCMCAAAPVHYLQNKSNLTTFKMIF